MTAFDADDALVGADVVARVTERPHSEPTGVWDDAPTTASEPIPEEDQMRPREFDPKHREPFLGLLYVGYLDDEVTVYGHKFRLATPTNTERLQIGMVISPWRNTLTEEIAYGQAVVSAFLHSVDGTALPEPVTTNPKDFALRDRFNWVGENLKRPVINALFDACLKLDAQVDEVLAAMGKAPRQPE